MHKVFTHTQTNHVHYSGPCLFVYRVRTVMEWLLKMKMKYIFIIVSVVLLLFTAVYFMIEEVNEDDGNQIHESHQLDIDSLPYKEPNFDEYQDVTPEEVNQRLTVLDNGEYHDFEYDRVVDPVNAAFDHAVNEKLPFITWWTPFSQDPGRIKRCWSGDCYFTMDRSLLKHELMKGFLFYGTSFNHSDLPLPRKQHHEWGLLHEESPKNEAMFFYKDTLEIFNHTSTFRQESDYPITTQYVVSASYLLKPLKYTVEVKNKVKAEEKLASIVYIQSGCNPPSDRDAYIQELQKHVPIDCYGKCLHNKDLPNEYVNPLNMFNKGFLEILEKYKFIISFENGICKDYLTEKLYRTLHVGAVPIYKGAPNVKDWLPSRHSAIVVDDFESPKQLAEYIKSVDENDDEYNRFLQYKSDGITNSFLSERLQKRQWGVDTSMKMSFVVGFECHVCDQIHQNKKLVAAGSAPVGHRATFEHYGCPVPTKYDLPSPEGTHYWERDLWQFEYDGAASKVNELKKILKSNSYD